MSIPSTRPVNDSEKLGGIGAASTLQSRGEAPSDLNDARTNGAYILGGNSPFANAPERYGALLVFGESSFRVGQVMIGTTGKIYARLNSGGTWTEWYDVKGNIDGRIPLNGSDALSGTFSPAVAAIGHIGTHSKYFKSVVAQEIYANNGLLVSRSASNPEDYISLEYRNHKILNAHATDTMKLCSNPGVQIVNANASGFVEIKASAFTQQSSVRYKDILGDMTRERARKVLDLDLIKYRYKPEVDDNPKTRYGIKAEQADELELWDLVEYSVHDGQPEAVDYSKLTPYLLGTAKEHDERIEQLEAKAAKLDALSALLVEKGVLTQEEIEGLEG